LFYFSGHGVSLGQQNFLIPNGFPVKALSEITHKEDYLQFLQDHALQVEDRIIKNIRNAHCIGVVILDACRTSTILPTHRVKGSFSPGLTYPQSRGVYVAYAAEVGRPAQTESPASMKTGLSPYTHHLVDFLSSMDSKGLGIDQFFEEVNERVRQDTGDKQIPFRDANQLYGANSVHLHVNPVDEVPCPASQVLGGADAERHLLFQRQYHCRLAYMALLASEAVYQESPQRYINTHPKTFARYLKTAYPAGLPEGSGIFNVAFGNTVIVAFRGTAKTEDLMADLNFPTTHKMNGRVHQGFYERSRKYDRVMQLIIGFLRDGKEVVLTGHSLGGAVASMMALRLLLNDDGTDLDAKSYKQLLCVTFGSPLVGDKAIADSIQKDFNRHFINYVHETDIVPRILLLHKDVAQQLHSALDRKGIFDMAEAKVKELLVPALQACLAYLDPAAAAGATLTYEGLKTLFTAGLKWYADESMPDFVPFGNYMFCESKRPNHPVTIQDGRDEITAWMQHMKQPDVESIMCHKINAYAGFLERLRIGTQRNHQHREL